MLRHAHPAEARRSKGKLIHRIWLFPVKHARHKSTMTLVIGIIKATICSQPGNISLETTRRIKKERQKKKREKILK